jgi:hypothetical protein
MKKIVYISILSLCVSIACSDNIETETSTVTENKVASFEDYFEFLNTETDGSVIAQSISTPLSNEAYMVSSSIKGDRAPLNLKVENKTFRFSNRQYSTTTNKSYSNVNVDDLSEIFGNKFNVELTSSFIAANKSDDKTTNSTGGNSEESVYIPNIVKAEFLGLQDNNIVSGSEIVWNADSENENGIVISFEYDPLSQLEESIANQNPDNHLKGVTTEDDGSYTIIAQDLAEFPDNAIITIYVARAGFGISTNINGEDYSLAGVSAKVADFKVKK